MNAIQICKIIPSFALQRHPIKLCSIARGSPICGHEGAFSVAVSHLWNGFQQRGTIGTNTAIIWVPARLKLICHGHYKILSWHPFCLFHSFWPIPVCSTADDNGGGGVNLLFQQDYCLSHAFHTNLIICSNQMWESLDAKCGLPDLLSGPWDAPQATLWYLKATTEHVNGSQAV